MAVVSPSSEIATTTKAPSMEPSPSRLSYSSDASGSGAALYESSTSPAISPAATPEHDDPSNSSPSSFRGIDIQSPATIRSEEYRQLFRLPPEEVLVEDFNCAFQENILIQGHMYLFVRYICFYSNIFGFETKKLIPFNEVTSVRRAKTAGIFPNAIEIFAGSKKYFFASFLSRDEAFQLIHDGWMEHSNGTKEVTEQQESTSVTSSQEKAVLIEKVSSFKNSIEDSDSTDRNNDITTEKDPEVPINAEDDTVSTKVPEVKDTVKGDILVLDTNSSASVSLMWKQENHDAPKISEDYTLVAESQFQIKVEDFFNFFFSDNAVDFIESFHKSCGDKEFKCNSWYPHDQFGYVRDVSFQHPIKIYFGAKFGGCQETQKFRLYRNSHLVVETSQEISDVPYGDYFRVEALWDVEKDADESRECCRLRVYLNVAFSKRTVWKGKIVQSTLEECREAYATWISMGHELLKKKLEKQEKNTLATVVADGETHSEIGEKGVGLSERPQEFLEERLGTHKISHSSNFNQQGKPVDTFSLASWFRELLIRFSASLKSQGNLSMVLVIIFLVILLMQLSIIALLARPQHIHLHSPEDYMINVGGDAGGRSSEALIWLEKRVHHLKDEMYMVEARLERMRKEHSLLKAQLEDVAHSIKHR